MEVASNLCGALPRRMIQYRLWGKACSLRLLFKFLPIGPGFHMQALIYYRLGGLRLEKRPAVPPYLG
jgi:hypothetical protein